MRTIKEILGNQYTDFMEYCIASEKIYPTEIYPSDYVAFRVQYGINRDYVNEIRNRINNVAVCKIDAATFDRPKNEQIVEKICDVKKDTIDDELITIEDAPVDDVVGNINDESLTQNYAVDDSSIVEIDEEEIGRRGNKKIIEYDIHSPLYSIFEIDNPEKYSNISIEAMEFKPRVERILKGGRRESVLDVLRCSIAQLFDFSSIARTAIAKIIEQIKKFVSYDINSIGMKLRQVTLPLYKLFNIIDVEQYKYVTVDSVVFGRRFTNALKENGVDTLYDFLQFSIEDLQNWEHLGSSTIRDVVRLLNNFFSDTFRKVVKIENKSLETIKLREKVVAVINAEINGKLVPYDDLDEKELALYSKIKEGIDVCGEEFYIEIKKNPDYAKALGEALREYYIPILEVLKKKNKIFQDYCLIPLEFRNKSAKLLYKVYELRTRHKRAFLDRFDEQITISELVNKVRNDEIVEWYQPLGYFLQWIKNIDINNTVQEIFSRDALASTYKVDESLKDKYWLVL